MQNQVVTNLILIYQRRTLHGNASQFLKCIKSVNLTWFNFIIIFLKYNMVKIRNIYQKYIVSLPVFFQQIKKRTPIRKLFFRVMNVLLKTVTDRQSITTIIGVIRIKNGWTPIQRNLKWDIEIVFKTNLPYKSYSKVWSIITDRST